MKAAILVIAAALAGCAAAPGVRMSDAEAADCKAHGCSVWTEAELRQLIDKASEHGRETVLENLDTHGCMRGKT